MAVKVTDDEFIACWKRFGSPELVARHLGIKVRGVYSRRASLEKKRGERFDTVTTGHCGRPKITLPTLGCRAMKENVRGTVIIGGDLHAWPGERSVAFAAFIEVIKQVKPVMVIMNGDVFDGSRVSRHPPTGYQNLPSVAEELEAVKERLGEIEAHAPDGCPLIRTVGNHDYRFEAQLAMNASDYANVPGFSLDDHLPAWQSCMSLWINNEVVVKHRYKGGDGAALNNTRVAGKTMCTNHTHRLLAMPFNDYNGLRYGIECGTLSDFGPESGKVSYAEDNPLNWSQGFVALTFNPNGVLLEPEFCRVIHGNAWFRGQCVV